MSTLLAPVAIQQFKDNNGNSLIGGQLFTYQAGTSIPAPSYTDATGTIANNNPVILNSRGEAPLWLTPGQFYKLVLQDATGVMIWTADQVPGGFVDAALLPDTASSNKLRADLILTSDPTRGGSLVGFIGAGAGAVGRTVQAKERDVISVKDFGSFGNGTIDDTFAFVAACASLGSKGGTVNYSDKHLIDTSWTVPPNVTLQGPYGLVGSPGNNGSANYGNMAALIINSAVTISLSGGAGHRGGLVYRKGLTFPTADSSAFAGTAFTPISDDAFVIDSMIIGFNTAYYSNGMQRPRLFNNWLDNVNGLVIKVCYDIAHIHDNHAWPFATIVGNTLGVAYQRTGTAYLFQDGGDWNKCTNNFSYGYFRGTQIINCNSMTLLSCSHDNTQQNLNSIGIEILGTSNETRILGCQVAAHNIGVHIATNDNTHTYIEGTQTWVNSVRGILIDGGNVTINGGGHRATPEGVTVNNANSVVFVDDVTFVTCPTPVRLTVASTSVYIGENNMYPGATPGLSRAVNTAAKAIASASVLAIAPEDTMLVVTGTTNIGSIFSGSAGRKLTLLFTSALSMLTSSGAQGLRLTGNANFAVAAGNTLSLVHNGSQWYETSRST